LSWNDLDAGKDVTAGPGCFSGVMVRFHGGIDRLISRLTDRLIGMICGEHGRFDPGNEDAQGFPGKSDVEDAGDPGMEGGPVVADALFEQFRQPHADKGSRGRSERLR